MNPPLNLTSPLVLLGATGVGKSAIAHAQARRAGAAILSLDAMQVYRGADLGTSKPTEAERDEVPYGGLDLVDPGQPFDVAQFLAHARTFLAAQAEAQRPVILVGGTGLYYRALTRGLCEAPPAPPPLREELNRLSVPQLQARLRAKDPAIYPRLDAENPRRLIRALEVIESTGRSLLVWQEATPPPLLPQVRAFWFKRAAADLEARLAARLDRMLAAGWANEVADLVTRHGAETIRTFPAIGYRALLEWAEAAGSACPGPEVRRDILATTRQFARRQLTWFSREPNLTEVILPITAPAYPLAGWPVLD